MTRWKLMDQSTLKKIENDSGGTYAKTNKMEKSLLFAGKQFVWPA